MDEVVTGAETPAVENIPVAPSPSKEGSLSIADAMRSVVDWRRKSAAGERTAAEGTPDASADDPATPEPQESTGAQPEDSGDGNNRPPAETQATDPTPEEPPIDPPRSWSKEDKEVFKSLPRATQEALAQRERARETDFSRRQQEATERAKALDAERAKMEQARTQYESALPQLLDTLQQQQAGEFSDIKTIADVERLAREDWPRYLQWDLAQKKIAAVHQEMIVSQQRQAQDKQQKFSDYAKAEDARFIERVPDMADPDKAAKLQKQALGVLKDIGFDENELGLAWNGQKDISLRDHRVQLLIRDAILWRDAQAKARTAATRPVPPVVRPGAAQNAPAAREQQLTDLEKRLSNSGSLKDAAALLRARRASR